MTIDERIAVELRRHAPPVDEQVAWERIRSAAGRRPRWRWQPLAATVAAVALISVLVGLLPGYEPGPEVAEVQAAQMETIERAVAAANASDAAGLRVLFAEGATIDNGVWGPLPLTDPDFVGAWLTNLQAWRFDGEVTACRPAVAEGSTCQVRARWHTLAAEADEEWSFTFDGDLIRSLTIVRVDLDPPDRKLWLGLAELDDWEEWLEEQDPDRARRLIPDAGDRTLISSFLEYDPTLADEIGLAIREYVIQRLGEEIGVRAAMPGEAIRVASGTIEVGDGLVTPDAVRADDRTYILAGRVEDWWGAPEVAVLAAVDQSGAEVWRIELGDFPLGLTVVDGHIWVSHAPGTLSRIDPADGTVTGTVTIGESLRPSTLGAFGSVWVEAEETNQVFRVGSDLSATAIRVPQRAGPDGLVAAAGAVWVPLGGSGVAAIDPETDEVTIIPAREIGHEVLAVGVDGDTVFVASDYRVTSLVALQVVATAPTGRILALGRVEGEFGLLEANGRFQSLGADHPVVFEARPTTGPWPDSVTEIDGELWTSDGLYTIRRVEFDPEG